MYLCGSKNKTMNDKLDLQSTNITAMNIEKIAVLFPNCVTETAEGKCIDFDLLKQELSTELVEGNKERYRLEWPGKREAIVTANIPTNNTLRPVREDSVDFDTTENIYIEGDNLEVLKLLQESYLKKIKMIYIDPPYNTGKDFVYKDNFAKSGEEELLESGQKDEYGQRLQANPETSGRYHSDWLSMMYPRLKLARNLLTDDGVIFISIDDNEIDNLIKIGTEIFGNNNLIGPIIQSKLNSKNDTINVQRNHEYIVIFRKTMEFESGTKIKPNLINKTWSEKKVFKDKERFYFLNDSITTRGEGGTLNSRPNLGYSIYYHPNTKDFFPLEDYDKEKAKVSNKLLDVYKTDETLTKEGYVTIRPPEVRGKLGCWTWSFEKFKTDIDNIVVVGNDNSFRIKKRTFVETSQVINNNGNLLYRNYIEGNSKSIVEFSTNEGTIELNEVLKIQGVFDNPKNINLLKYLINLIPKNDFYILDFFSGSATTAHAVMQLNAEDQGNRKYIMVQLPEATDEKSEAYKAGYKNICEIGKERIRRAANKVKEEKAEKAKKEGLFEVGSLSGAEGKDEQDYGFRVYRLDSSNMQDVYYKPQDYNQGTLDLFADNVKDDRSAEDLVAQIMLDWGLELSLSIELKTIAGKEVYAVAGDSLYCCFDKGIDEAFAKEVAKDQPLRIVFRDNGFKDDTAKENVKQLLKQLSVSTEMKVV